MVAYGKGKNKGDAPRPPATPPPRVVKKEMGAAAKTGETDREAKIRAKMEKIRSDSQSGVSNVSAPTPVSKTPTVPSKSQNPPSVAQSRREDEDARKLEGFLPPLEQKVTDAEDEAERVAILAAPLAMEATPEIKDLQLSAIKDTERAVKAAMSNVAGLKREIDKRQREVASYAPVARESAGEELGKLVSRLDEVQKKLEEHKGARKDHELTIAAEKLFGELSSRLSSVEMDCEKAAMMAEALARKLGEEDPSPAEIREAKEALRIAQATLAPTSRLIAGKLPGLKGAVKAKMVDLQSRAEAAQAVLEKAQKAADEAHSRIAATPMLKELATQLAEVEEKMSEMRESEGPFLMGIETLPGEEGTHLIAKMEKTASAAQTAIADAHKYVSLKLVEMGRFAEKAAEDARAEMERMKESLDQSLDRVRTFQADTMRRKRANNVEIVRGRVEEAENAVTKVKEAAETLKCASEDEVQEALDKGHALHLEATNAVTLAKRELQDLRDTADKGGEIVKTKARVTSMETELTKFKKIAKEIEEKRQVEKSLVNISAELSDAEMEIDQLHELSLAWPTEEKVASEDEMRIVQVQEKLSAAIAQVDRKLQKAQGLELKELRAIFGRLKTSQAKLDRMKESIKKTSRAHSAKAMKGISELVRKAETKLTLLSAATSSAPSNAEVNKLEEHQTSCADVRALVAEAHTALASAQPVTSGPGVVLEAKVEFARLQLRLKGLDRKVKREVDAFQRHFQQVLDSSLEEVVSALRTCARRQDGTYDVDRLFSDMAAGAEAVTVRHVTEYLLARQPELPEEKVRFAFCRAVPHGCGRGGLASLLARFLKVVRDITITDTFEIQATKKIRRLELGELVEVISENKEDNDLGLERVQCRLVQDGITGWVTIKSKGGTYYLERATKPFLWCQHATPLTSKSSSSEAGGAAGAVIREILPGEVLELMEGPRHERRSADLRVRGIACHEDSTGWLQVQDKAGDVLAKVSPKLHKCVEAIAMTDNVDFENCKMIRRIEAGEALEKLPEKAVVPEEGGTRQRYRACKDGNEGWVTEKGSQGTVYVRPAPKHYLCLKETPMHAGLGAESAVVRVLMPGEAFAAFEEPKEVTGGDNRSFYKVRASTDGVEGWVTSTAAEEVQAWSKRYKVLRATPLTRDLAANEAAEAVEVIRVLEPNESVDVAEPPVVDKSTGQLRIRCSAVKDKVLGWATVREGKSSSAPIFLSPAASKKVDVGATGEAAPATPPGQGKGGGGKRGYTQVKQETDDAPTKWHKGNAKGKGKYSK